MRCNFGTIELKDGDGPRNRANVILEVTSMGTTRWAYLSRKQAGKIGKLLLDFSKSNKYYGEN